MLTRFQIASLKRAYKNIALQLKKRDALLKKMEILNGELQEIKDFISSQDSFYVQKFNLTIEQMYKKYVLNEETEAQEEQTTEQPQRVESYGSDRCYFEGEIITAEPKEDLPIEDVPQEDTNSVEETKEEEEEEEVDFEF